MDQNKNCIIIYGYAKSTIIDPSASLVILVEPRKEYYDEITKLKKMYNNLIFIPKVLMETNVLRQVVLYNVNEMKFVVTKRPGVITSRQDVYTTSLLNIIKSYDIDSINEIIVNIDIDNIDVVLDNIVEFNNIITKVTMLNGKSDSKLLLAYFRVTEKNIYYNKNLGVEMPRVTLFLNKQTGYSKEFNQFIKRYRMNNMEVTGCYDKMEVYEYLLMNLDKVFLDEGCKDDIIMQFNSGYLINHDTFNIKYPIEDDILYVYKQYDIIYGNKSTMYNLYAVLKSDEFNNYIDEKKQLKGKLYKFFSKNYFYDYISKVFDIRFM